MSSSDIAVSVRGVSKAYTISHNEERHVTLAETVLARMKNPFKRAQRETFWALNDVSFDIKKGDVVGIIGRNGAGKSTLLKILSRITQPTKGEIEVRGRIGSLLEVGTGFHPELTGRENVFLNGAILGMNKAEIRKQFDAIVDFAGVEQFIDTPVKRYSSGMYVRLAFAVAAHLRTELLIVDEVLAVGDADFQRKCLGKMRDIASGGRTVIFVSHNMAAIENLCTRAILLDRGTLRRIGSTTAVLSHYQSAILSSALSSDLEGRVDRTGSGLAQFTRMTLEDENGIPIDRVRSGQTFSIVLNYRASKAMQRCVVDVGISLGKGDHDLLTVHYASYAGVVFRELEREGQWRCTLECVPLSPAIYRIGARLLVDGVEADWPRDGIGELIIEEGDFFGTGMKGFGPGAPVLLKGTWQTSQMDSLVPQ